MQEQGQNWRQKARVRSLITEIAMLIMMLIGLVDIGALFTHGFVVDKGLGIHIGRGQVMKFGKVERRGNDKVHSDSAACESVAGRVYVVTDASATQSGNTLETNLSRGYRQSTFNESLS